MKKISGVFGLVAGFALIGMTGISTNAPAAERDPLKARVPANEIAAAKALKNPVPFTAENVAKGKALFEGKGTCFNCHGKEGKGDGPAGAFLDPSPRNFNNCAFHKKRKDGELFWVLKNGSPGTAMVPFVPTSLTEKEAWTVITYERSFCESNKPAASAPAPVKKPGK